MLIFGHIGITAGVAEISDVIISSTGLDGNQRYLWSNRIKDRVGWIDYRLVVLGSLLPDIIDKPVFLIISGDSLSGRDYAHGLLFNLVLLIVGLVFLKLEKPYILSVSLSSMVHLVFDQMWNNPVTLFWPLLGPLLGKEVTDWLPEIVYGLFNSPGTYIPEILGVIIVVVFVYRLIKMKSAADFIKNGIIT